ITLAPGDSKTCIITNDDEVATLTVIKAIINDNGGTAVLSSFTPIMVNGTTVTNGTSNSFNPGTYFVTETNTAGYTASFIGACDSTGKVILALGNSKTCIIINDDIAPKLTVTKIVTNDNGGTKVVSDFPLFVDETGVTSGVQNTFSAGNYTVSETGQSGYTGTITGDCASDGTITLNPGDVKSCTITNDDQIGLDSPLFGTDANGGHLLSIDTITGIGTIIGSLGSEVVFPSLAIDPTTGIMYAGSGGGSPFLYTVNQNTGVTTFVNDTGLGFASISGMDFSSNGTLYATVNIAGNGGTGGDHLATINKNTGIATIIGSFGTCSGVTLPSSGLGSCTLEGMEGIAFSPSGTLYGSTSSRLGTQTPSLYTINTSNGTASLVAPFHDESDNQPSGGVVSLQFLSDGTLFGGTARAVEPATDGGKLIRINSTTGLFHTIGTTTSGQSLGALAVVPDLTIDVLPGVPVQFVLPGGLSTTFTLPGSSANGTITIGSRTLENPSSGSDILLFLGLPMEITLGGGASCSGGCTLSFTFTDNDLASVGISDPLGVTIFQDNEEDGTFVPLVTTLVDDAPSPYTVLATFTSTSFFGAGTTTSPSITQLAADDIDDSDPAFSNGDTITLVFSKSTNQPGGTGVQSKLAVNNLFNFTHSLGTDYSGQWIDPSTFRITINNAAGGNPQINVTTVTVKESANLRNAAGTSLPSTSTSPPLSGSFGGFSEGCTVGPGGTCSTVLPSGIESQTTLPPGVSGTITIETTTASNIASNGTISFLGEVIDVIPSNNATCATGCTITFIFNDDDLASLGIGPSDVKIFHDKNNDGDFADAGETLVTTVVPNTPPGPYTATAQDNFTSKFAIGGIRPALFLGGASGEFSAPSFSAKVYAENEYPLTINGAGFKLEKYSNTIPTVTIQTAKQVQLKALLYDPGGVTSIQHLALYLNLRGMERDIPQSDTYIIYDKSAAVQISDPNGYFDSVTVTPAQKGNKLEISFDVTFKKPMAKSDIIFRTWDDRKNSADTKVIDAIEVTGEAAIPSVPTVPTETVPTVTETAIPSWIKNNAGWWSEGSINDSDFVSGIQFLIKEGVMKVPKTEAGATTTQQIPKWIKSNAGWWKDGLISDSDFVSGIQYLISNGIMKV
ncbi:MAG: beta strand repeat-containing protein, partial [Nitrososphaerales archaeon]